MRNNRIEFALTASRCKRSKRSLQSTGRPTGYAPHWLYSGSYKFGKHYYPTVGELKPSGEEFECAKAIDLLPQVKHWVRNLERQEGAFWLPVATGKFYPDFVAELEDGRLFVVEYKGANLATNVDSRQKQNVGELWEAKSKERGLFLMPTAQRGRPSIYQQLTSKLDYDT